jgi:hypothetical protein
MEYHMEYLVESYGITQKSHGISNVFLWNILWNVLWNPMDYPVEYPMESYGIFHGSSYGISWNIQEFQLDII